MNISIKFDPCSNYKDIPNNVIYESCGILPEWVVNPDFCNMPLYEALKKQYKFPMCGHLNDFTIDNGVLSYPDDPDFYPLIKIQRGKETFYQYKYSMISIVQEDGSFIVTRMS